MSESATLVRFAESNWGTMGRLWLPGWVVPIYALENEWHDNMPRISRIPPGIYACKRTIYHRHGYKTFEVTGVPGRSRILFHPGNTEEDTEGCILLGEAYGPIEYRDPVTGIMRLKLGLYRSKRAFEKFMRANEGVEEFTLDIQDDTWRV